MANMHKPSGTLLLSITALMLGILVGRINKPATSPAIAELVRKNARAFALEPELVEAVLLTESGGRIRVVSGKGAVGLMQLMPGTAQQLARRLGMQVTDTDLFTPKINIRLGSYYLHLLLRRFPGDLPAALAAYNTGPNRVDNWLRRYPSQSSTTIIENCATRETRLFMACVLRRYADAKAKRGLRNVMIET